MEAQSEDKICHRETLLKEENAGEGDPSPQGSNLMEAQHHSVSKSDFMEVFSVKFLEFDQRLLDQMYGCILITSVPTYVVYSREEEDPLNVNREGFVKIRGPGSAIEPLNCINIVPNLFRYQACEDQFEDKEDRALWNGYISGSYDELLSRKVQSQFGPIEINYAVYENGVEARVGVTLSDCPFLSTLVYGSITVQNSMLREKGRSFLFSRDESERIRIDVSPNKDKVAVAQLPLSRSVTVHPINSHVVICVSIWQSSIMGAPDQPIAKNEILNFTASLSGREVRSFRGDACQVNVEVMWAETPETIELPYM